MKCEFVKSVPDVLEEGIIYISIPFATVIHSCACGCGNETVTPLSPIDWQLTFDGKSVSLYPSIGNWSFECKSHYWIKKNRVIWDHTWTQEEIDAVRRHEFTEKNAYYGDLGESAGIKSKDLDDQQQLQGSWWNKLRLWLRI